MSKFKMTKLGLIPGLLSGAFIPALAQDILPFPTEPSNSIAGISIAGSVYKPRVEKNHLPEGAPNIIVILVDDAGSGLPNTFGGEINTSTLTRLANRGISFNRFHTTAMSSPTRAALLTGRNHTRVENGQITEMAVNFDGFSGVIPKTSATIAEVLKNYGYNTAAFGKWHNTPALHTSKNGPFEYWPIGYGFEHFYGFLGGETSQYEPTLIENTTYIPCPKTPEEGYHLTEDIADRAIDWIKQQKALNPDKPFFLYWAPGAVHGPHHVAKEWADKYKGKFDDGWDKYRERVYTRQKQSGWIPANTKLTERDPTMTAWKDIPESEKPFQRRLMEVYAGYAEHMDYNAGRIIDAVEKIGVSDNTIIIYIWGDNGSSAEGLEGSISELTAHNQIPTKVSDHIRTLDELGGQDVLGGPLTDNIYHSGWAWAGSTPYKGVKLQGAYMGGIRNPMVILWPEKIKADRTPRSQFHHVNDIVPTIYDVVGITQPKVVNGFQQGPFDGISMAYTFNDSQAKSQKVTQFFDIMSSRGIYHDGWFACTRGPRIPWQPTAPEIGSWTPEKDVWELYNLDEDFSQANNLAKSNPEKLAEMKELFLVESARNNNLPIGAGMYLVYHPEAQIAQPQTEFNFPGSLTRLPEFGAPRIGSRYNKITIDADIPENPEGVLIALGAFSGGLTVYIKDGYLNYEYNLFEITRYKFKSQSKLSPGKTKIEILLEPQKRPIVGATQLYSGDVTVSVNDRQEMKGHVDYLVSYGFTMNECLDVGVDLGSPISLDYYHEAPFKFNGTIDNVNIKYLQ